MLLFTHKKLCDQPRAKRKEIQREHDNLMRICSFGGKKVGLKHNGEMQGLQYLISYLFWKLTVNICPQFHQNSLFYMHSMNLIHGKEKEGSIREKKKILPTKPILNAEGNTQEIPVKSNDLSLCIFIYIYR